MTSFSRFSRRTRDLRPSPIREILAVIDQPGMISFAGGLPAAATFPPLRWTEVGPECLQYGPTEGERELRELVAGRLQATGLGCAPEQVLILSGSQQGIDLVAKLFIDPGTPVAVESPTYLAALQAFRYQGAQFVPLDPAHAPGRGRQRPAFAYAIPTFQNPTGRCLDRPARAALAAWCDAYRIPLFEDDPYRELAYEPCERTPVAALMRRAPWIYQGSFSKTFAPGLRLGFIAASAELVPFLTRLKQASDLHSNRVSQALVLAQARAVDEAARLAGVVAHYRACRDRFADLLATHFADLATWQTPPGGLFFWLELVERIDTRRLLPQALARQVAFMPGEEFHVDPDAAAGCMRLNFSHANGYDAARGLERLADLVREATAVPLAS